VSTLVHICKVWNLYMNRLCFILYSLSLLEVKDKYIWENQVDNGKKIYETHYHVLAWDLILLSFKKN
jgi:hypothetical protein